MLGAFVGACVSICVGACGVIAGAIGSIGAAITGAATTIANALKTVLTMETIEKIINVIDAIARVISILLPQEDIDEIGDKAMQAEKKPEDFDSIEDYMNYLRNDVEFDKEKFDKLSDEEKLARKCVGTAIVLSGINEKLGTDFKPENIADFGNINLNDLNKSEFKELIEVSGENLDKVIDMYSDNLTFSEEKDIIDTLKEGFKELYPELSDKEIEAKLEMFVNK